jgi:hypothetical protein
MTFIEEYPWTCVLGVIGLTIGLFLPSGLDILSNIDYSQISTNPAGFLTGYMVAVPLVAMVELISGLIGGIIGGIIGLFADSRSGGAY